MIDNRTSIERKEVTMSRLRRLTVDDLTPHPRVQLEHTFRESWVRKTVPKFDESALGVLTVCEAVPAPGNGKYYIVDGRHRHALVARVGHPNELRCDDHGKLTDEEAAALKLMIDRDRRRVTALEHYEQRLLARDPVAIEIDKITRAAGWTITASNRDNGLACVTLLETVHTKDDKGAGYLRRTLKLAADWRGERGANTADWIAGLAAFVKDGLDERLTQDKKNRLAEVVPVQVLRKARGRIDAQRSGDRLGSILSYEIAEMLRKAAGVRRVHKVKGDQDGKA